MAERDIKEFLYAFLMKRYRTPPVYDVSPLGKQFELLLSYNSLILGNV